MGALNFRWLDAGTADAVTMLAWEMELFEKGEPAGLVWESARECVVLGSSSRAERDVDPAACLEDGVAVLRRNSGGGAVLLGPGCLNYALVLPWARYPHCRDVRFSFEWILGTMRKALAVGGLRLAGEADLALADRKVSGNAQRRGRFALLHHGTLLYGFDAARAERLLRPPQRQPAYRAGRTHRDFLGNLPLTPAEIRTRVHAAWVRPSVIAAPDK